MFSLKTYVHVQFKNIREILLASVDYEAGLEGLIVINSSNIRWNIIPVFDGPYKEAVFPLIASWAYPYESSWMVLSSRSSRFL